MIGRAVYGGGGEGPWKERYTDLVRRIYKGVPFELCAELGGLLPISSWQCKDGLDYQVSGFTHALCHRDRRLPAVERLRLREYMIKNNFV